jgi:AraC-like DNA-binding protein
MMAVAPQFMILDFFTTLLPGFSFLKDAIKPISMLPNRHQLIQQGFILDELFPANFPGTQLAGSSVRHAKGVSGDLVFQQFDHPLFSIRFQIMHITKPLRLLGEKGKETLSALLSLKSSLRYTIEGLGSWLLPAGHFLLIHPGNKKVNAQLDEPLEYQLLEIACSAELIHSLKPHFPFLQLLYSAPPATPISLTQQGHPAGPAVLHLVQDMLHCQLEPSVRQLYFEYKIREYLLLLLVASNRKVVEKASLTVEQMAKLSAIAEKLRREPSKKFPIAQLAKEMQTNTMKLKKVFKAHYGKGVYSYQLEARMQEAHRLLDETSLPTKAVAAAVGYNLTTSFITKFREYFGYPPSQVRLKK